MPQTRLPVWMPQFRILLPLPLSLSFNISGYKLFVLYCDDRRSDEFQKQPSAYLIELLCKKPGFLPEVVMLVIAQKPGFFCTSNVYTGGFFSVANS
jgi:hypothetical protein